MTMLGTYGEQATQGQVLEATSCVSCGVLFAMPASMLQKRREDGKDFWCPNGHSLVFTVTETERLRKEAERLRKQRDSAHARATAEQDQRRATERSNRALRGWNTRMRNAAAAGKCLVESCTQHFDDLREHMATEHPDFADQS